MIIDDRSFLDIAVHLRHASDEMLSATQRLARLCDPEMPVGSDRTELVCAVDSLVQMNREFVAAERVIRAVWDANRAEARRLS